LLLLLTHLVHDDGLSVQIIIHERKLRVKGVGIVRVVVLSIRVVFHHPLRGIVVGYVLVLLLGGEHLRHERVLLSLLTRISHDKKFFVKIRVRWYINNVLFFFLSRSRVRKMPSSSSLVCPLVVCARIPSSRLKWGKRERHFLNKKIVAKNLKRDRFFLSTFRLIRSLFASSLFARKRIKNIQIREQQRRKNNRQTLTESKNTFFLAAKQEMKKKRTFFPRYEDMKTESKNNNNENNKSPPGRRGIQIEDIRYARKRILSGFCDGSVVVATAFGESSSSPVVVSEEEYRRAMEGLLLDDEDDSDDDKDDSDDEGKLNLLEKAKTTKLLPKETKAVVDMIRRDASNALKLALMSCCSNKNPQIAGEVYATREILFPGRGVLGEGKEERDDDDNDFDDDDIADIKDKILSRKTMEFWEAAVSRIEFEYERRKDSARIEAAAKRVRARYNEFLSQYVYALDAKYKEDKENRSANEAMDNLKLRVSLLKDAVMKRREGDKARIFSKKFALEAKHLLVELKMPSPEAVALYQFVSSIDLANNK